MINKWLIYYYLFIIKWFLQKNVVLKNKDYIKINCYTKIINDLSDSFLIQETQKYQN